jgi:hypothetical protein
MVKITERHQNFVRCMTASSFAASTSRRRRRAASSFPTPPKKASGGRGEDESGKIVPLDVKAGDRILFGKRSGTQVRMDGEDLLIMKESDIMGVVTLAAATRKAA